MRKVLFLFTLVLSMHTAFSQTTGIDSMLLKIAAEKDDNKRIDTIYHSTVQIGETNPLLGIKYAQGLLDYSQKNKDKIVEGYAMSFKSKMYGVSGNLQKALEYALNGNKIAEETGNEKLLALSNSFLGLINKFLSNYPKSINYYKASAEAAERANYEQAQVWAFQNLADIYLAMNKVDSAFYYAQKDYTLSERMHYYDFFCYTLINLGAINGKMGNASVALDYFERAISEALKSQSPRQQSRAYTVKAQYLYDIHERDSSIINAKKALAAAQHTDFANFSIAPAQLLLNIYRNNNVDSAFKYSEVYRVINDSLFNARSLQQMQVLTFEDELRQQRAAEEKAMEEEQRKQNIQYALIAIGIITFIILFLMLTHRFIISKKLIEFFSVIALLLVFEFLNLVLHSFLERITHHTPVLMLLALVCIAAMLVPLHHKAEKWATNRLLAKNEAVRLANAKTEPKSDN